MKKGVVLFGSLILALAMCVPAVAQPSTRAVETFVIDNFDTPDDMEWQWGVQASRFVTDGYPILKTFEGIPNSLRFFHKDTDPTAQVLGVKVAFDRKGDNWFEVFPTQGEERYEYDFFGTVTQIDFWVWGANYNYNLELLVRDADGRVHSLYCGTLQFQGWRNIIVNIPGYISQHSRLRNGRRNMSLVGFRVRSHANEAVDNYVIYFDQLKYTSNTLSNIYDGYDLRDSDFGDSNGTSSSASSSNTRADAVEK